MKKLQKLELRNKELISKEFNLRLDKDKQELFKEAQGLEEEKLNLKKIYEKKENNVAKEKDLELTKEIRELQKQHKEQAKKDKEKIELKIKDSKENQKIQFQQKIDKTHQEYLSKIEEYKIQQEEKIKIMTKEYEDELERKCNQKKNNSSTGDNIADMVKEVRRHNLELENEILRKEREEKKQKEELIKLQVKLEDLHKSIKSTTHNTDFEDGEISRLNGELYAKQRRLNHLRELIKEQELAATKVPKFKSMKTAKRMVEEIGTAIDTVKIPQRKVDASVGFKISENKQANVTREFVPISSKMGEIFTFTGKEIKKVSEELEKAELEYKLISGLKNNLHKENVSWKKDLVNNSMLAGRRKTLSGIYERMEDQSNALEHEKKKLAHRIDKIKRKENILMRIANRQKAVQDSEIDRNTQSEIQDDYEYYMRTFVYKIARRRPEDDIDINEITKMEKKTNYNTMYEGYEKKKAPKYTNMSRLMSKVFQGTVMKNNFMSSMNKTYKTNYSILYL